MPGHKCEGQMFTLEIKGIEEGELEECLEEEERHEETHCILLEENKM